MIPLVRAHLRALSADPMSALWGIVFPLVPALILTGLANLPDAGGHFVRALALAAVYGVAAHIRGRASTPAGIDPFGQPMGMLPVSDTQRIVTVVLLAEGFLLVAIALVSTLAWWAFADAPDTNPFAGIGLSPGRLPPGLLAYGLTWVPWLVAGARRGNSLTLSSLVVGTAVAAVVTALHVERTLWLALPWAIVGTLLALQTRAPSDPRPRTTLRVRPGLRGMLTSITIQTGGLTLLSGGVGVVVGLIAGHPLATTDALVPITWTLAALLPILPAGARGAQVVPMAPEALFRLPVDRVRTTLSIAGASVIRGLVVVGIATAIHVAVFGPMPAATLGVGVVALITSTGTMGTIAALGGSGRVLLSWVAVAAGTAFTMWAARSGDPSWWAWAAQLGMVAVGGAALLVGSGRLGFTGRSLA